MIELTTGLLLPLAAGYIAFLVIAKQLYPWKKPMQIHRRPRWILGCWLGATLAVASTFLMFYLSAEGGQGAVAAITGPIVFLLIMFTAGGTIAWLSYRNKCRELENQQALANLNEGNAAVEQCPQGTTVTTSVVATQAINPQSDQAIAFNQPYNQPTAIAPNLEHCGINVQKYDEAFDNAYEICTTICRQHDASELNQKYIDQARELARQQYNIRCEAEKNLRVTRSALRKLESEHRTSNDSKADAILALEEQLQEQVRETSKAESRALQEADRCGGLEHKLSSAKDMMLQAKSELRSNTDARARALLTARKAVNFARRSVEARERADKKVDSLKDQLKIQGNTTSTVIKALEREKQKVADLYMQLEAARQNDEQAQGLRKLNVSTSEKTSTPVREGASRIIKRVARHRSTVSD